jgi:hypothetical protein
VDLHVHVCGHKLDAKELRLETLQHWLLITPVKLSILHIQEGRVEELGWWFIVGYLYISVFCIPSLKASEKQLLKNLSSSLVSRPSTAVIITLQWASCERRCMSEYGYHIHLHVHVTSNQSLILHCYQNKYSVNWLKRTVVSLVKQTAALTLYQPMTHICVMSSHKPIW